MISESSTEFLNDLRKRFTIKRNKLCLSLRDISDKTGICFSTLARFERGAFSPSRKSFELISKWLKEETDKK